MIFADKLISLRKKYGISQEEFADKLNVTRQSVSKWEGAQSLPDLQKMIQISQMFGVSTDVLLKDELSLDDGAFAQSQVVFKKITAEQVTEILQHTKRRSVLFGIATALCFLAFAMVWLFMSLSSVIDEYVSNLASILAVVSLFVLLVASVSIFACASHRNRKYKYLNNAVLKMSAEVDEIVDDAQDNYQVWYIVKKIIGLALCILSLLPILLSEVYNSSDNNAIYWAVCICLFMLAVGSAILVSNTIRWNVFTLLLQQRQFARDISKTNALIGKISIVYWPIVLLAYILVGVLTLACGVCGVILLVAVVVYILIVSIIHMMAGKL